MRLTRATRGHHTASVPTRAARAADLVATIEHNSMTQMISNSKYMHAVYVLLMSAVALMN